MKPATAASGRISKRRPATGASPVTPGGKGRYGDFDVLSQVDSWDLVTAGVVLARLDTEPQLSFFTAAEEPTARALVDLLLAQHDEPRVPVLQMIDRRLMAGETDGWRYSDMAEDGQAWRDSLAALDAEARTVHDARFHILSLQQQSVLVQAVQDAEKWHAFVAAHLWSLWTRYACTAFYSHPWAWNEMGFGGPAYPRGYKNMGVDRRESWETMERDAADPVPWADRREAALRAHEQRRSGSDTNCPREETTTLIGSEETGR